jgi:hypothetical protein
MKMKQIIPGVNNNQRFRVILNGVGFYTTVKEMTNMPFTEQRVAVWLAIERMKNGHPNSTGFATTHRVYDEKMQVKEYQVQVDLV